MGQNLLTYVLVLTIAVVVFGMTAYLMGGDNGLAAAEPDGRSVPLPGSRPLHEADVSRVRFDAALRGYRMGQVDEALSRAAYDIGYKDELISVLEAEVTALREGRTADAEVLRRAREAAVASGDSPMAVAAASTAPTPDASTAGPAGDAAAGSAPSGVDGGDESPVDRERPPA